MRGQGGHMTACAHGMVVLLAGAHGGGECWPIYWHLAVCVLEARACLGRALLRVLKGELLQKRVLYAPAWHHAQAPEATASPSL